MVIQKQPVDVKNLSSNRAPQGKIPSGAPEPQDRWSGLSSEFQDRCLSGAVAAGWFGASGLAHQALGAPGFMAACIGQTLTAEVMTHEEGFAVNATEVLGTLGLTALSLVASAHGGPAGVAAFSALGFVAGFLHHPNKS